MAPVAARLVAGPAARQVRRGFPLLTAILAAALCPAAWGANVSVVDWDFGESVAFVASPGETNDLQHSITGGVVTARDEAATLVAGPGCIAIDAHEVQCSAVTVSTLGDTLIFLDDQDDVATILGGSAVVYGGAGNDHLSSCDDCPTSLFGEDGDDTINGNSAPFGDLAGGRGDDLITGSTRRDSIWGGPGNDTISGGDGDDNLRPGSGNDVVDGGSGDDSLLFDYFAPHGVEVRLPAGTAGGQGSDTVVGLELVYGTNKADRLVGNADDNFLNGLGGMDILIGGGGNDSLYGGEGTTRSEDRLWGGPGNDKLQGLDGDDLLVGGAGRDLLLGGTGDDRFGAFDGTRDRVNGAAGIDRGRFDDALDAVARVEIRL